MGALSIAFDTIIVGALALSWLALVVYLFFSRDEKGLQGFLDWVKKLNQPAAASVVLFAGAYFLGSVVSRVAQDFFNDDDLYFNVGHLYETLTEDNIRSGAYCSTELEKDWIAANGPFKLECPNEAQRIPQWVLLRRTDAFDEASPAERAGRPGKANARNTAARRDALKARAEEFDDSARNLFHYQESTLLMKSEDATERLRQLRDQISVLRGAAFNGFLSFSFCLFGWRAIHPRNPRWMRARGPAISPFLVVPAAYLAVASVALWHHFLSRSLAEPPFMEFTLFVLGFAGVGVLWKATPGHGAHEAHAKPAPPKPRGVHGGLILVSILVTATAFLGWWMTEVLYDQQVIYSYYAESHQSAK
ncbi:MAG TPA: hypothetical protein VGR73_03170 [Bryobacteraceae bacterium]|nr:hypothetical protein [Bryobacteraceae bacterium]